MSSHCVKYVLRAQVLKTGQREHIEQFELALDGDGLCMGYHGWVAGDFGDT